MEGHRKPQKETVPGFGRGSSQRALGGQHQEAWRPVASLPTARHRPDPSSEAAQEGAAVPISATGEGPKWERTKLSNTLSAFVSRSPPRAPASALSPRTPRLP